MPDTADTGYTGDTGDTSVCQEKLGEYEDAMAAFDAAKAAYEQVKGAASAAEAELEAAWETVAEKQAEVKSITTECELIDEKIEEKEARIAEIDAIDPESRLDEIMPILTGDQYVADASPYWLEANYLTGLLQERAALVAELDVLRAEQAACPEKIEEAEAAVEAAKADRSAKYANWDRLRMAVVEPHNAMKNAYNRATNAANRYYDQGCEEVLGYIDYPELPSINSETE